MPQQEKRFTARHVDEQFEHYVQAIFPPSDIAESADTPNSHVVNNLHMLYGKQILQEQEALERMRQRLSLAIAASQQKQQQGAHDSVSAIHEAIKPETHWNARLIRPQRPWLKTLERVLVALLVMAIVGGWVALSHWPHSTSGSQGGFDDTNALPLGEPVSTVKGNFNSLYEWSSDSRTLVFLQVNTQKNELDIHMLDVASGHTTIYPVLDPSWIPALNLFDPFQILMGRYLLAVRAQGNNQATMVIWDIAGRHAITTQTLPAKIGGGQVQLPQYSASSNEQKLAVYFPDGTVTIWDVASGQKMVTCEGKIPLSSPDRPVLPRFQWYDHDQDLQFYNISPDGNFQLVTCDAATGNTLFSLNDIGKTSSTTKGVSTVYVESFVSPDNKYLALAWGVSSTASGAGTLEILDAQSGQLLHRRPLDETSQTSTSFFWLPDSQRLLLATEDMHDSNSTSTSEPPKSSVQVSIWNAFTGQTAFVTSSSQLGFDGRTHDGRYILLATPDMRTMDIWQISNGQKVAIVTTPGVYARTDSFFYTNNQQIVIGQKGNFDIWDIATGKLMYQYHGTTPFSIPGVGGSIVFWSPDGKYLTMMAGKSDSMGDGVLSIWRIP